jgi:hypothetical protein
LQSVKQTAGLRAEADLMSSVTDWAPVVLEASGSEVIQTCSGCGEQTRIAMEPAAGLLDGMQSFVARHTSCPRAASRA